MDKVYNKHLFFIKKSSNWDNISEELRYKKVHDYVLGAQHPVNKRQDLARKLHYLKLHDGVTPNSEELLELAIGVTIA